VPPVPPQLPPPVRPVAAATVIPVRARPPGPQVEVLLLRRARRASFMPSTFVFPGGRVDAADGSAAAAAIRELFEEAGVLLARAPGAGAGAGAPAPAALDAGRRRLLAGEVAFAALLDELGLVPDVGRLHLWTRFVTPSFEPRRFDALFFVAAVPPDAEPRFDARETVEQVWVTPGEALARQEQGALALPPPQIVTLAQLLPFAATGLAAIAREADARAAHVLAITPRAAARGETLTLLMPWDPEYETLGVGEGAAIPAGRRGTEGPSRMDFAGGRWRTSTP
jgi:8-oxo-dGTP pyrophosphatase MutT (NUDIX family)